MPSRDDLLADAPIGAAVAALAERNRHHLEQMTDAERSDALSHWHDLAVMVLTAAGAALGGDEDVDGNVSHGRAVIVLEDAGGDEVAVHASFFPQLEDLGGEVLVTPAQAAALELLDAMTGRRRRRRRVTGVTNAALDRGPYAHAPVWFEDPHGRRPRTRSPAAPTRSPSLTGTSCSGPR